MERRAIFAWSIASVCALACFGAAGSAAAVPRAAYLIVPGHSIGKVQIGEGVGPLLAAIGPPHGRTTEAGPGWLYPGGLEVVTDATQLQVVGLVVWTRFGATQAEAARYATRAGIHVGSTLREVEKAYPHARCTIHNHGCLLISGTRTTQFRVATGKNELASSSPIIEISVS